MGLTTIKRGFDLPIAGVPEQVIHEAGPVKQVAILGEDYIGMKPTMLVSVGDTVKRGQVVFTDKKTEGVKYTAPASGTVKEINRGEKRAFLSLVIEVDEKKEAVSFSRHAAESLADLDRDAVKEQLIESGMWTVLRNRPFGKVPEPGKAPRAIFVTAMDTDPLAPDVELILKDKKDEFVAGLRVLSRLTDGKIFVCKAPNTDIPTGDVEVQVEEFAGPHPAGLAGTHMHFLSPASRVRLNWQVDAQNVAALGEFFLTGDIPTDRVVSLAGPGVKKPRLLRTRVGACLTELTDGELAEDEQRIVSGSVLSGRKSDEARRYLGRYHQIISVLPESHERVFLGWTSPAKRYFSIKNVTLAALFRNQRHRFTTEVHGSKRAVVPVGSYERVMPLDILPTYLLRALAIQDVEDCENLGCMELIEEDLALCSFVCPSKIDHMANLRKTLNIIEKEG